MADGGYHTKVNNIKVEQEKLLSTFYFPLQLVIIGFGRFNLSIFCDLQSLVESSCGFNFLKFVQCLLYLFLGSIWVVEA